MATQSWGSSIRPRSATLSSRRARIRSSDPDLHRGDRLLYPLQPGLVTLLDELGRDRLLGDRSIRELRRDHQLPALRLALEPRRDVHRLAKVVEDVVGRHGVAGSTVD